MRIGCIFASSQSLPPHPFPTHLTTVHPVLAHPSPPLLTPFQFNSRRIPFRSWFAHPIPARHQPSPYHSIHTHFHLPHYLLSSPPSLTSTRTSTRTFTPTPTPTLRIALNQSRAELLQHISASSPPPYQMTALCHGVAKCVPSRRRSWPCACLIWEAAAASLFVGQAAAASRFIAQAADSLPTSFGRKTQLFYIEWLQWMQAEGHCNVTIRPFTGAWAPLPVD